MRERWDDRLGGVAAIASGLLTLAAGPLAARGSSSLHVPGAPTDKARLLLDFHGSEADQLLAAAARGLSVLLVIAVAAYLFRAVRRREPAHSRAILGLGIVACTIVAATTVLGFFELRE